MVCWALRWDGGVEVWSWWWYWNGNVTANSLMMERETACNGNVTENSMQHGSVALTANLQWQRDSELLNNAGRDCLQWQMANLWQSQGSVASKILNGNMTANSLTMERLLAMAMLWSFGGDMVVWHWQQYCNGKIVANSSTMERVTACNGNAMANWRRCGGVALLVILHGQRDGKLINNGETACDGDAMVNWRWCGMAPFLV